MNKKDEKHSFTEYSDLLREVDKKHNTHMQTKGRRVSKINPFSEVSKDIRLIHKEAKVNPWYVYRNYFSEQGKLQLYKEDYSSVYCMFNNVNTWINSSIHSPYEYTNIIRALISLALTKESESTIVYVKDSSIVKKVETIIKDEIYKLPFDLMKQFMSFNRISVVSSYPNNATWLAHMYDNIVVLDLYEHTKAFRFITLFNNNKDKTFLVTTNELGNQVTQQDALLLKFKNSFCTGWTDHAYDYNGKRIKKIIDENFMLHDYNY